MNDTLKLWFFRDLTDDQRLKLFSLFGLPVGEIGNVHGRQTVALDHIASKLVKLVQDEALSPAQNVGPDDFVDKAVAWDAAQASFKKGYEKGKAEAAPAQKPLVSAPANPSGREALTSESVPTVSILWAQGDDGSLRIRKWSQFPIDGGLTYSAADQLAAVEQERDNLKKACGADGAQFMQSLINECSAEISRRSKAEAQLSALQARIQGQEEAMRAVQMAQLTNHGCMSTILSDISKIVSAALHKDQKHG